MPQEKFNLVWNTFTDHLKSMIGEWMTSPDMVDVTLVCEDKKYFKAHKIILSACSPVFKSIINNMPEKNPVIFLRGIHAQEIEAILQFIYLGQATVNEDRINELLNVANSLDIKEIGSHVKSNEKSSNGGMSDVNDFVKTYDIPLNQSHAGTYNLGGQNQLILNKDDQKTEHNGLNVIQRGDNEYAGNVCYACDIFFTRAATLRDHNREIHEGIKHTCDKCNKQFSKKSNLQYHKKMVHEGVKYNCSQCNFRARTASNLQDHFYSDHMKQD